MRLTHYEDGFLCGDRLCINLIRHLFLLQASLWSFALQSSGTFSAVNIIQLYFENVLTPVSLRLGHAAALTAPRAVIHYRVAASLPDLGEGKS